MPIRPEMKARYPVDWKAIVARINARAGDRCEWCGVPNRAWVVRYRDDRRQWQAAGSKEDAATVRRVLTHLAAFGRLGPTGGVTPPVRVVLTTAHVHDHDPANCADGNLAALCQTCHLRHDAKMHGRNAAETRRQRAAKVPTLFPEAHS